MELRRTLQDVIADSKQEIHKATSRAKTIQHMISFAALAISHDVDRVHRDCWECGKVCKSSLSACSCCKTANYCSAACQRRAWSAGHKFKCKSLEKNYNLHQESLEVMEATHAGENDFSQQLTILEEKVGYRIFSHVLTTSAAAFRKGTMNGPSMKYFYQNLDRIQNNGWWMISIDLSPQQYQQAQIAWGNQALDEELHFLNLCHVLCFDLMGFYLPKMQMELLGAGHAQLQNLTDGQLVALAITSDLGFHKRHPRETGLPMPASRFLQLYQSSLSNKYDCGTKLWSNAKRQLQKQVLKDFRTIHHK